jgi:hypothetical protein
MTNPAISTFELVPTSARLEMLASLAAPAGFTLAAPDETAAAETDAPALGDDP